MKYLLIVLVVLLVLWLARSGRRRDGGGEAASSPPPAPSGQSTSEEIVACAHCGVHLPRSEALPGRGGLFCGEAHRLAFERVHSK